MSESPKKARGLGRGLSALFGDEAPTAPPKAPTERAPAVQAAPVEASKANRQVAIDLLHPNRSQPRRIYDAETLQALSDSIARQGVLQPLLVRPHPSQDGHFEIVAGERRWRAAQQAKLSELPVVVRELDDRTTLEMALVENIQREDLTPLEEAEGYRRLIDEFGHAQSEIAKAVGKSRSHVANMLRLLGLPEPIKRLLEEGALSAGHARALLGVEGAAAIAEAAASEGWSVREVERRAKQPAPSGGARPPGPPKGAAKDADTLALENDLSLALGLKVVLDHRGAGGQMTLHYASLDQLDDLVSRLRGNEAL